VCWINGADAPGFAHLFNHAAAASHSDLVVMMCDRVYPKIDDIDYAIGRLMEGFGFVGLAGFSFIALNKAVIKKIGFMDERYKGSEYCNIDFLIRMGQHNIPVLVDNNVGYLPGKSKFDKTIGKDHFEAKWQIDGTKVTRLLKDEAYSYNIGLCNGYSLLNGKDQSWIPNPAFATAYALGIQNSVM